MLGVRVPSIPPSLAIDATPKTALSGATFCFSLNQIADCCFVVVANIKITWLSHPLKHVEEKYIPFFDELRKLEATKMLCPPRQTPYSVKSPAISFFSKYKHANAVLIRFALEVIVRECFKIACIRRVTTSGCFKMPPYSYGLTFLLKYP